MKNSGGAILQANKHTFAFATWHYQYHIISLAASPSVLAVDSFGWATPIPVTRRYVESSCCNMPLSALHSAQKTVILGAKLLDLLRSCGLGIRQKEAIGYINRLYDVP